MEARFSKAFSELNHHFDKYMARKLRAWYTMYPPTPGPRRAAQRGVGPSLARPLRAGANTTDDDDCCVGEVGSDKEEEDC